MAIEFKLPDLGENVESGDVLSVLVHEGDTIDANQNVIELETDKATVEIPCPYAGRVTKIHVEPGQTVPIGTVLLSIEAASPAAAPKASPAEPKPAAAAAKEPAETKPQPAAAKKPAKQAQAAADDQFEAARSAAAGDGKSGSRNGGAPAPTAAPREAADGGPVAAPAGPSTRRLARELGVDLRRVTGTGPGGRITRDDIVSAVRHSSTMLKATPSRQNLPDGVEDQDAYGCVRKQPLTKIRKTIAANMARSHSTIPHVTNFDDADITELEHIRKGSMADYVGTDLKLTMMAFVTKAVAQALKLHPLLNASLDLENNQIIYKEYVNIGIAVDTERGLVVPVIRDADQLTIPQIAHALTDVSTKGRNNQFAIDDLRGGTFTISNLGAIGGTYSTPIINHPEVGVLLLGRSRRLPIVAADDSIQVRLMMPLSLSYDHRLVDGAVAARFLNEVKNYLQVPGRLLLAP